jgi:hypothetical protein
MTRMSLPEEPLYGRIRAASLAGRGGRSADPLWSEKIPELGRGPGEAIRDLKKSVSEPDEPAREGKKEIPREAPTE